ncbi:4516_t:CDS:2 [Racocetra fulgida]|uniref:Glucosamine 6-phosphate N-acetyltransferase n=1 Tax=Racocetra fulgida TaxID=60492 RepID=A0A9N8Z9V1_9GLOM|nr:4516_t:CDS:2 [Racocetra fulgida]
MSFTSTSQHSGIKQETEIKEESDYEIIVLSSRKQPKKEQIRKITIICSDDESLISDDIQRELPQGYKLRPLAKDDFNKEQLTVIGDVSEENFIGMFLKAGGYYIIIIESDENKVVAVGTLFVEMKFIRGCGKVGHIEDIVVHDSQRGKNFGKRIIEQLKDIGKKVECYKIILDCSEKNVPFYRKCGLETKDLQMTYYYDKETNNQD